MGYIELEVLNNPRDQRVLGIDLGTTNSLAAIHVDGRPQVVRPDGHTGRVPSVIHFPPDGHPIVGRKAREQAIVDPRNTIFSIKRFMGRGLADVQEELASFPFPVSEDERGLLQIEVHGRKYTPQELSSLILMRVHDLACRAMGGAPIERIVITVPAYFDDTQRQATRDAARLAGLEVLRIINEPTAASLAYGLDQGPEGRTIAVYDLGGGTFDISVLSIEEGVFRVLSTAGDTHLGGDDLDRALAEPLIAELRASLPPDEEADPALLQAARLAAEKCKIELSERPEADLHLVVPHRGITLRRRVTRDDFEKRIAPFVERSIECCRRAISDANVDTSRIDEVVLVGGSTRVPMVRRRVEEFFGRRAHAELDPEEVVALGAAVQGNILVGGRRDILLMDVIPLSLGLETMGGAVSKIVHRNTTVPCQATEGFTTYVDGQTAIDFNVLQGERELARDCRSLGRFRLSGIPPMPAGMPRVAVRFHVDADGLLTVSAREESTGKSATIEIQPMHGLTDAEVERMLQESLDHAAADFDASRAANLEVEIGTMLRATEKNIPHVRDQLDPETLAELDEAMREARAGIGSGDVKLLQKVRDRLEQATLPLAAALMDGVAKAALAGKRLDEV